MSLDWRLGKIKDNEKLWDGSKLCGLTETIIYMCLFIDMGEITEKNVNEFAVRARMHELVHGALRVEPETREDVFLTHEEIARHVGLSTNVATKSNAAWHRRLADGVRHEATCSLRAEKEANLCPK